MKILLTQDEIAQIVQDALVDYANQHLSIPDEANVDVVMLDDGGAAIEFAAPSKTTSSTTKTSSGKRGSRTEKAKATSGKAGNVHPLLRAKNEEVDSAEDSDDDAEDQGNDDTDNSDDAPNHDKDAVAESKTNESPASQESTESSPPTPTRSLFQNLRKPVNS